MVSVKTLPKHFSDGLMITTYEQIVKEQFFDFMENIDTYVEIQDMMYSLSSCTK
jgi:hypothetical protein